VFVQAGPVNLLLNPSFEDNPGGTGQGILPSNWLVSNVTPDTYSNDGSYGLSPGDFGNFPGVTAFDGIRWVAGWSSAGQERFGQTLAAPLTPNTKYDFSAYLHQAFRADLNFPGGYNLYLTSAFNSNPLTGEFLGFFGVTSVNSWEQFSLSFTAPSNADTLPFLMFAPIVTGAGSAYPGLDKVSLTAASTGVPEPATLTLLLAGLGVLGVAVRRKL